MPRSHSPAAYPTAYWRLIESFTKSELPIHVQCSTPAEAVNRRNEWNSFIRALERSKDPRNAQLASVARGRICATGGANGSLLIWKSRDTGTFIEALDEALDEYEEIVGDEGTALLHIDSSIIKEEPVSHSESAIDDFLGTPEENATAEGIFDEFLAESEEVREELKQTKVPFADLLTQPLRPQKLNRTFSSETNDPEEVD